MIDQKQLEVVDSLYKCILTPENWGGVLEQISDDIGAFGINMFAGDRIFGEIQNVWLTRNIAKGMDEYMQQGFHLQEGPIATTISSISPRHKLLHIDDIEREHNRISNHQINLTALNKWLYEKEGIKDRFLTPLNYHASHFDTLCISLQEQSKAQTDQSLERCNFYLPHVANLVNYARPFLLLKARFNAILEVLDKYKLGVFLLSETAEVLESNQAARDILAQKDGILLDLKKRLLISDSKTHDSVKQAITELSSAEQQFRQKGKKFSVSRPSGRTSFLLEVSAMMHHDLPIGTLVIAIDPDNRAVVNTDHFSELFGLTSAEQNICQLLTEGRSTNEISEIRNTGRETVRGQVKSVLEKTKSSKQSDLVRLAVSINIPIDKQ